jgi:hypothetical protein
MCLKRPTSPNSRSEWRNVELIVGAIPGNRKLVTATEIAYLHLDMNNAGPEVAAFEHFWDKLVPGALVLLDDYAYAGFEPQKLAMDSAAAVNGVRVASLPTGQGLLLKACTATPANTAIGHG